MRERVGGPGLPRRRRRRRGEGSNARDACYRVPSRLPSSPTAVESVALEVAPPRRVKGWLDARDENTGVKMRLRTTLSAFTTTTPTY